MIQDSDIIMLTVEFERRSRLHCLFYIVFSQRNKLTEVFIQSYQNELQTLSLILGSILALPLNDMKQLAVQQEKTLFQVTAQQEIDEEVNPTLDDRGTILKQGQD
jgi:hypothetical protein